MRKNLEMTGIKHCPTYAIFGSYSHAEVTMIMKILSPLKKIIVDRFNVAAFSQT